MAMEKLYSTKEVAQYFRVSVRTVHKWTRDGDLKPAIVNHRRLYAESQLKAFYLKRGGVFVK